MFVIRYRTKAAYCLLSQWLDFPSRKNADVRPVSWQLTDDDLTFAPRGVQAPQPQKSRIKKRVSHAATTTKQEPSPVVPIATPTFAINESDSDGDGKDDDGEYTGEHQLTRIRRGRQVRGFNE